VAFGPMVNSTAERDMLRVKRIKMTNNSFFIGTPEYNIYNDSMLLIEIAIMISIRKISAELPPP
jgi:hypothetical protein